jgi:hypothetical protein
MNYKRKQKIQIEDGVIYRFWWKNGAQTAHYRPNHDEVCRENSEE